MSANQVVKNLWMGAAPPPHNNLRAHFDHLVLAAEEYQPDKKHFGGLDVLHVPMNDDKDKPMSLEDKLRAMEAAHKVIEWMKSRQRVLVTCESGHNRSGLIIALALIIGPQKASPDEAIKLVRAARGPLALLNTHFVSLLYAVGAALGRKSDYAVGSYS